MVISLLNDTSSKVLNKLHDKFTKLLIVLLVPKVNKGLW